MGSEEDLVLVHHLLVEVADFIEVVQDLPPSEVLVVGLHDSMASLGANFELAMLSRRLGFIILIGILAWSLSIWFWRVDLLGVDLSFWLPQCD